jgi:Uma2 family endonuclease
VRRFLMGRIKPTNSWATAADLLAQLGGVPPERVCFSPLPGTATEKDLLRMMAHTDKLYELIDGTLVEKTMGYGEGGLALDIARLLGKYLDQNDLGDLVGADTTMRILPKQVRLPDLSFIRWEKFPNRERPAEAIPSIAPDLAIEVLSESNTAGEMERKRKEYFFAGTQLVWEVDPRTRTVDVYTTPDEKVTFTEDDTLDGGEVLPGLKLPVRDVFARVPSVKKPPARKKPRRRNG